MRRNKQVYDRAAHGAELQGGEELSIQLNGRDTVADDLADLDTKVQSYIAQRNELAQFLTREIEATEKKLLELRRTKARLFPEGSVEIIAEREPPERKPKKSAKTAKATKAPASAPSRGAVSPRLDVDFETADIAQAIASGPAGGARSLLSESGDTTARTAAIYQELNALPPICAASGCGSMHPSWSFEPEFELPILSALPLEPPTFVGHGLAAKTQQPKTRAARLPARLAAKRPSRRPRRLRTSACPVRRIVQGRARLAARSALRSGDRRWVASVSRRGSANRSRAAKVRVAHRRVPGGAVIAGPNTAPMRKMARRALRNMRQPTALVERRARRRLKNVRPAGPTPAPFPRIFRVVSVPAA